MSSFVSAIPSMPQVLTAVKAPSEILFISDIDAELYAAQAAGFPHVFNVADGFEGPPDVQGHRGATAGWKASGLPWRQK